MSAKLFQYAAIMHPTEKQAEEGASSEVIVGLDTVLAADQNAALMIAARKIPDDYMDRLERIELVIRPF